MNLFSAVKLCTKTLHANSITESLTKVKNTNELLKIFSPSEKYMFAFFPARFYIIYLVSFKLDNSRCSVYLFVCKATLSRSFLDFIKRKLFKMKHTLINEHYIIIFQQFVIP